MRRWRMADIVPAWMWRDPGEIIEGLLRLSQPRAAVRVDTCARLQPDRYYTMARRLDRKNSLKRVMRRRR